jgi:hypothetical protein
MKQSFSKLSCCALAAAVAACWAVSPAIAAPETQVQTEVKIVPAVSSRALRDTLAALPQEPGVKPDAVLQPVPNQLLKFSDFRPLVFNPTRAVQPPLNVPAPAPALNYLGLRSGQPNVGGFFPPDTTADVSDVHILQMVNVGWALFSKTTGATVSGPNPGNSFWQSFPAGNNCRDNNDGDPIVMWDKVASRWVVSQFSVEAPYSQCFAVSKSSDPLGEYWLYEFVYPNFNDYGKMGLWVTEDGTQNAYLLTMHEFQNETGGPFVGSSFAAVERDKMLAGQPAKFIRTLGGNFGMVPLHLDSAQKLPSGACPAFVHFDFSGTGYRFWDYCLNWAANTATIPVVAGSFVASEPFSIGLSTDPVQRDANVPLDSFDGNTMYRPAVIAFGSNGPTAAYAVVTHTVNAGTAAAPKAGARWVQFELFRTPRLGNPNALFADGFESILGTAPLEKRVLQQGVISPDASGRFMTAGAMDQNGNVAVGFTASGPNLPTGINPEVRYTARRFSDPAGTMMEEQSCTPNGVNGPYTGGTQAGRPSRRWGDYSMVMIDPSDRCTFYVTNEYSQAGSPNSWATRVCSFKFDDCGSGNFLLETPAERVKICTANPRTASVRAVGLGNFTATIALSSSGFPAGITPSFSPSSITAGGQSAITLGGVASAAAGVYSGTVTGTSGALVRNATVNYEVATALPAAINLLTPVNASGVALTRETFTWSSAGAAGTEYLIEIARDAAFTQIFETARVTTTSFTNTRAFALSTQYFWRVTPFNACGAGNVSATNSFTTITSVTSCPAGTTSTVVFSDDVSGSAVPWVVSQDSGPASSQWARVVPPTGTGFTTQSWYAGNSAVTADQFLTSPAITVPASGLVLFGFDAYTQYETVEPTGPNCWDGGSVEISVGAGAFEPLGNARNLANPYLGRRDAQATAPGTEAWCVQATPGAPVRTVFSLNDYRGQSVRLRYRSTADTNTVGPVPNGMAVDNVQVLGCQ